MDPTYIVITAKQAEEISTAFTLAGECKIIANSLTGSESVTLLEEDPSGNYVPAVNENGIGVVLNVKQPSQIVVGYGSYKLSKTVTGAEVAVAVITA